MTLPTHATLSYETFAEIWKRLVSKRKARKHDVDRDALWTELAVSRKPHGEGDDAKASSAGLPDDSQHPARTAAPSTGAKADKAKRRPKAAAPDSTPKAGVAVEARMSRVGRGAPAKETVAKPPEQTSGAKKRVATKATASGATTTPPRAKRRYRRSAGLPSRTARA